MHELLIVLLFATQDLTAIRLIDGKTPESVQIALAKAAGPHVSDKATIYVLGPAGYRVAIKGTNGFACLVERGETGTMEPECYDAEGVATTLKARLFVEEERGKGGSEDKIKAAVDAGYKSGRFLAPRRAGIVYMMSDYNYVFDPQSKTVIHFPGHLMFYAPNLTANDVGSGDGAPYLTAPGQPENLMIVVPAKSHTH